MTALGRCWRSPRQEGEWKGEEKVNEWDRHGPTKGGMLVCLHGEKDVRKRDIRAWKAMAMMLSPRTCAGQVVPKMSKEGNCTRRVRDTIYVPQGKEGREGKGREGKEEKEGRKRRKEEKGRKRRKEGRERDESDESDESDETKTANQYEWAGMGLGKERVVKIRSDLIRAGKEETDMIRPTVRFAWVPHTSTRHYSKLVGGGKAGKRETGGGRSEELAATFTIASRFSTWCIPHPQLQSYVANTRLHSLPPPSVTWGSVGHRWSSICPSMGRAAWSPRIWNAPARPYHWLGGISYVSPSPSPLSKEKGKRKKKKLVDP